MLAPYAKAPSLLQRLSAALKPPAARPYVEMGVSGTAAYGGYIQTREKSAAWSGGQRYMTIADMAGNASIVAAGVHYFLNLIARPTWTVEPADESSEAKQAAEFFDEVLHDMDRPWSRVVRRAGIYRFYGFGVQEWTAKKRLDGKAGLASVEARPQHSIDRWSVSDSGAVEGVWQRSPQDGAERGIPRSKIMYLVEDALTDSPEGVGIFRHLAEPWERLKAYYDLEARAFERDLRGIPVGRVPYAALQAAVASGEITKDRAQQLVDVVEKFVQIQTKQSTTAITLDSQTYLSQAADGSKVSGNPMWGLELLQGAAAGVEAVGAAITRTQEEMARILTCEHLLMGGAAQGGNRSLAEDKSRNLYLVANAVLADIAEAATHDLVEPIWLLNGLPDELKPRCTVEDVAFQDADQVAGTLQKMAQAGAVLSPDDPVIADVRSLMGVAAPAPVSAETIQPLEDVTDAEIAGAPKPANDDELEDADALSEIQPMRRVLSAKKSNSLGNPLLPLFKFNPNHDERGRFSEGQGGGASAGGSEAGGAGVSSNGAAAALLEKNVDPAATLESITAGLTPQQREMMDAARAATAAGTSTRDQFLQADGTYTPEREALHEEIIGGILAPEAVAGAMPAAGERPELVMTGGRPAAGKTSALREGGIDAGPPKYVYLSADAIQESLPGYSGDRAGLYNPEAQDIADKVETAARSLGVNLVFDATMKTGRSATERVDRFRASGYDVSVYFVHTAPEVSALRSVERFVSSGRFVPPEISFYSRTNEATFDALTPKLKRWALFDNNGSKPKLVARSG